MNVMKRIAMKWWCQSTVRHTRGTELDAHFMNDELYVVSSANNEDDWWENIGHPKYEPVIIGSRDGGCHYKFLKFFRQFLQDRYFGDLG
jgi:hypothetical protein